MTAHFAGGEYIPSRRLREVEVAYVDDPSLEQRQGDSSDDCPVTPPPTYYLKVGGIGELGGAGGSASWNWRYVDVQARLLRVWDRRGGILMHSAHLSRVKLLRVVPEPDALASTLEVHIGDRPLPGVPMDPVPSLMPPQQQQPQEQPSKLPPAPPVAAAATAAPVAGAGDAVVARGCSDDQAAAAAAKAAAVVATGPEVLTLQARSRRETLLWAEVLQENIEQLLGRKVPLENLDGDSGARAGDDKRLALLLTHQLSKLAEPLQPPAQLAPPAPQGA